MLDALVASPASYFIAGLIGVSAVLSKSGKRFIALGPMAILGLAMYVISTGIITSYHYVAGEYQVAWWTMSLLIVGLLYLAITTARGVQNLVAALFAAWIVGSWAGAMAVESDLLRRMFWVFQYAGIGALAFVCFLSLRKTDLLGHLVWGVLFIAEWIGAFQVVDCQLLHGLANQPIVEGSACAQVYNWSVAPFLPTILPTLLLGWILFRWFTPREM